MKHLPNMLTLANLVSGCAAICFILNAQPYLAGINGEEYWVTGVEQMMLGSLCIFLAGIFDVLDGFAARALKIYSPIGADLDSLADIVSFGVAPSMIIYKMLWAGYMAQPHAMDVSMLYMLPAFAIAVFAALRLAKFNVYNTSQQDFKGMPSPAAGLFIAGLPFINAINLFGVGQLLQSVWILYAIIAIVCWLMASRITFLKLLPSRLRVQQAWPQVILVIATIICLAIFRYSAVSFVVVIYILLSLFVKTPAPKLADYNPAK